MANQPLAISILITCHHRQTVSPAVGVASPESESLSDRRLRPAVLLLMDLLLFCGHPVRASHLRDRADADGGDAQTAAASGRPAMATAGVHACVQLCMCVCVCLCAHQFEKQWGNVPDMEYSKIETIYGLIVIRKSGIYCCRYASIRPTIWQLRGKYSISAACIQDRERWFVDSSWCLVQLMRALQIWRV